MSALWQTAKRGGQGTDGRRNTTWDRCTKDGCAGRMLRDELNADGPELCFAHASDEQRSAALLAMRTHKRVDLRGTVLTEQHVLEIVDAVASAEKYYFRSCTFTGAAPFPGSRLKLEIPPDHSGFIPPGVVDFGNATFEGGADFRKVTFPGPVFFDDTKFGGALFLDRAHFHDEVWFLRTIMTEGHFSETVFDRLAGFHQVHTDTSLTFTGSVFSGRTDFDRVHAMTMNFSDATFTRRAAMRLGRSYLPRAKEASTECLFTGTQFDQGLELRLDHTTGARLDRSHFGASSTITSSRDWLNSTPRLTADHIKPSAVLSLRDTDVEKLSLVSVDLSECSFAGALNLDKLRLSGAIEFARLPRGGFETRWNRPFVWRWSRRDIIREELLWRADLALLRLGSLYGTESYWRSVIGQPRDRGHTVSGEHLASLYRSLRKAREDAKDEPGAGDFYYGEMEARRHSSPVWSGDRWLLTLYWALSGYGQRAGRALAALALLLVTLTVLLTGFGLGDATPVQRITDAAHTTAPPPPQVITIDLTGQQATVTVPPPATPPVALDVRTVAPQLPPSDQRWTAARVQRAIGTLVTSLVPINVDQRLTTLGGYLVLAGRVLGAILVGLAVLAIRSRVKR